LALPQTTCPSSAADTAAAVTPGVTRVLDYTTPSKAASSTTVMTEVDLLALSNKARAKLATASTTNTLSNYDPACFSILSPKQVQALVLRSAAASAAAVATRLPHPVCQPFLPLLFPPPLRILVPSISWNPMTLSPESSQTLPLYLSLPLTIVTVAFPWTPSPSP
jgi:hypothetical protein